MDAYENGLCGTRAHVHLLPPQPQDGGATRPWCGSTDRSLPPVEGNPPVTCGRCLRAQKQREAWSAA